MSHGKIAATFPGVMETKKLSQIKDKDERRFRIEDAARTFERFAEIKREINLIKADKELFAAARVVLNQKLADIKASQKS